MYVTYELMVLLEIVYGAKRACCCHAECGLLQLGQHEVAVMAVGFKSSRIFLSETLEQENPEAAKEQSPKHELVSTIMLQAYDQKF